MVVLNCFLETSSALDAKTAASAEIFLLDPESRLKDGAKAGSRRSMMTNNMITDWVLY